MHCSRDLAGERDESARATDDREKPRERTVNRREKVARRSRHHEINPTELGDCLFHRRFERLELTDVGRDSEALLTRRLCQFGGGFLDVGLAATEDDSPAAVYGEEARKDSR